MIIQYTFKWSRNRGDGKNAFFTQYAVTFSFVITLFVTLNTESTHDYFARSIHSTEMFVLSGLNFKFIAHTFIHTVIIIIKLHCFTNKSDNARNVLKKEEMEKKMGIRSK